MPQDPPDVPNVGAVKRKNAPSSEDIPQEGRSVRSRTSALSVKSRSSSHRPVPIVLLNAKSSKSTSSPVASSSRLSPNVSTQPPATASVLLSELERVQTKFGKDMMVALVEIARIRVQVEELRKAEEEGSARTGSDGDDDGADDA